jgi:alkanesulfonate monooxygenase SsuD/methylene tetrahydromethanopterin reductase-like flavin-dependent oxidoreductase (luciferase family)
LEYPIGVAEDWAVLDNLSRGRAILGVSPGERPEEFRAAGVSWDDREAAFREAVELIRTSWTQLSFQFVGEHYQFPLGAEGARGWRLEPADAWVSSERGFVPQWSRGRVSPQYLPVTPRPVQLPHPPIWVTACRRDTIEWAAQRGLAYLAPSYLSTDEVRSAIGWYSDALAAAGRDRNEVDVAVAREVFVTEDTGKARDDAVASLMRHVEAVRADASDEHAGLGLFGDGVDEAAVLDSYALVGTPTEVSDRLRDLVVGCGVTHLVCRVYLPGRDHLDVLGAIRLLAGQVKTRLAA